MKKFDGEDWTIHVVDHSRPSNAFQRELPTETLPLFGFLVPLSLNNQIIRLLSDLGNSHGVFEALQSRCIDTHGSWHPPAGAYLSIIDSSDQSVMDERRRKYRNA